MFLYYVIIPRGNYNSFLSSSYYLFSNNEAESTGVIGSQLIYFNGLVLNYSVTVDFMSSLLFRCCDLLVMIKLSGLKIPL